MAQSVSATQLEFLCNVYLFRRKAHGTDLSKDIAQHFETPCKPQRLEVYRRVGTLCKRAATLSRDILYPRKRYGGKVSDYSTKQHRMQTTYQNTHFSRRFGRNDFKEIDKNDVVQSVRYLLKYIEKSGERLVYGGDLPTYFKSDVMDEDIVCHTGIDDRKALLFDDFNCWDEGCLIGKVSPETISQLPKCN